MISGTLEDSRVGDLNRLRGFVRRSRRRLDGLIDFTGVWLVALESSLLRSQVLRASKVMLTLMVFAALLLRVWGVSHLHVWDENVYLLNAELILTGNAPYDEISSRPPLLSLLFAGGMAIWHSDYCAWAIATFLNALGPLFIFLGGRLFVGRAAAAIAAVTMCFSPFLANAFDPNSVNNPSDNTGHSLMTDCPALTLILLAFWLLLRALSKESSSRFFIAGIAMAASVLMRFGSLSSVGLLMILTLAARLPARALLGCLTGFATGLLPYLWWSRLRYGGFLATFIDGWNNFDGPTESPFFFIRHSVFIFSWLALLGLLFWCFAALADLWAWRGGMPRGRASGTEGDDKEDSRAIPLSAVSRQMYLAFWAVSLFLCFSSLSHKELRYILPAMAPLYLLSGVGWSALFQTSRIFARTTAAALLLAAVTGCIWQDRMRFGGPLVSHDANAEMIVSSFIRDHSGSLTTLYAASSYPDFAYYSRRPTIVLPFSGQAQQRAIANITGDGIVIAYKRYDDGSAPEPSLASLDANPNFRQLADFPTMRLYQHVAAPSAP